MLGPARLRSWLPVGAVLFPFFGRPFIYICYLGIWLWLYETSPSAIWNALTGGVSRTSDAGSKVDVPVEPPAPPEGAPAAVSEP
jgi:hypothetical protein